jgi:hypothetical protein
VGLTAVLGADVYAVSTTAAVALFLCEECFAQCSLFLFIQHLLLFSL